MTDPMVKFTMVFPVELEETVIETLLEMDPPLGGFTTVRVDGHGVSFTGAALAEQVRGRVARCKLQVITPQARTAEILQAVRGRIRFEHGAWWYEPVAEFGHL